MSFDLEENDTPPQKKPQTSQKKNPNKQKRKIQLPCGQDKKPSSFSSWMHDLLYYPYNKSSYSAAQTKVSVHRKLYQLE